MLMNVNKSYAYNHAQLDAATALKLKAEIEAFNAEYCAVLDNKLIDKWPEFFCEDAMYRVTARENADLGLLVGLIYDDGRDAMHDRALAINETLMYAPRYMLHIVTNTRVLSQSDEGEIEAEANFLLMQTLIEGPSTVHLAGRYYDTFVRSGDHLLLKERQVIYDTEILANDVVYPV